MLESDMLSLFSLSDSFEEEVKISSWIAGCELSIEEGGLVILQTSRQPVAGRRSTEGPFVTVSQWSCATARGKTFAP